MSQRAVLKNALASGQKGIGYWLTIPGPAVVRALTGIGGFNWVLIDGEHGQIGDKDFYELSCAVAAAGASPIVRVPNAEEWMVKRALDCGAHGIMTPMCHSAVSLQTQRASPCLCPGDGGAAEEEDCALTHTTGGRQARSRLEQVPAHRNARLWPHVCRSFFRRQRGGVRAAGRLSVYGHGAD